MTLGMPSDALLAALSRDFDVSKDADTAASDQVDWDVWRRILQSGSARSRREVTL